MTVKILGREVEAVELNHDEWEAIKCNRDTPVCVVSDGVGYYNSYTCLGGYAGTCRCINHPLKEWTRFNPVTGEILKKR